jgi:hypothetical protein
VLIHDLLPLFGALASDDQDSVRHLTVADLIAIAQQLDPQEIQNYLGTGIRNLWADKSWRVRYSVADNWVSLAIAVGGERAGEELVAAFVRLVKDNEAEVRSAIAKQIPGNFHCRSELILRILQTGSCRGNLGGHPRADQGTGVRSKSSSQGSIRRKPQWPCPNPREGCDHRTSPSYVSPDAQGRRLESSS